MAGGTSKQADVDFFFSVIAAYIKCPCEVNACDGEGD